MQFPITSKALQHLFLSQSVRSREKSSLFQQNKAQAAAAISLALTKFQKISVILWRFEYLVFFNYR